MPVISSTSMGKRQAMSLQITTASTSYNVTENILPAMLSRLTVVSRAASKVERVTTVSYLRERLTLIFAREIQAGKSSF